MIKVNNATLELLKERSKWTEQFGCPFVHDDIRCKDKCGKVFPELMTEDGWVIDCPCKYGISSKRVVAAMKEVIAFNS